MPRPVADVVAANLPARLTPNTKKAAPLSRRPQSRDLFCRRKPTCKVPAGGGRFDALRPGIAIGVPVGGAHLARAYDRHADAGSYDAAPGERSSGRYSNRPQEPWQKTISAHQERVVHILRNLLVAAGASAVLDLGHGVRALALDDAIIGIAKIGRQLALGLFDLALQAVQVIGQQALVLLGDLLASSWPILPWL